MSRNSSLQIKKELGEIVDERQIDLPKLTHEVNKKRQNT